MQKGEAYEWAQTLSLLPGGGVQHTSTQPGPTIPLAQGKGLGDGGEWLSPISGGGGVPTAFFV